MDYNTKLEECDQLIEISIPSERQLRQQYDNAIQFYKVPPPWADDWPSNAQLQPIRISVDLLDQIARVDIQTERTIQAG